MLRLPTLFIASTLDKASMNIALSLLRLSGLHNNNNNNQKPCLGDYELQNMWSFIGKEHIFGRNIGLLATNPANSKEANISTGSGCVDNDKLVGVWQGRNAFLWIQESSMLWMNYPEVLFRALFDTDAAPDVSNIIFLSKHSAASGQPSLTVHPIGIPYQTRCEAINLID